MTGYQHPLYSKSLEEFGDPCELFRCKGYILKRLIPGFKCYDAMGCYPLFVCRDWTQLHIELQDLEGKIVSLSLVTDPFGDYDADYLRNCFDIAVRFKEHFVADLRLPINVIISKHHRYYARRSLQNVKIENVLDPIKFIDEWMELYENLVKRHNLTGIKSFSRAAFAKQLTVPGIVMFQALFQGTVVGAHIWYAKGEVVYSHLAAFSPLGYDLMASYALYWSAIEYFSGKFHWLDLGGSAGVKIDSKNGLDRFKKGWSTGTRTAYFCGRIFDPATYREIVERKGISNTDYFPAYRKGEFV